MESNVNHPATQTPVSLTTATPFQKGAGSMRGAGETMRSPFDPNGSYTGTPIDGEQPVTDVDDI